MSFSVRRRSPPALIVPSGPTPAGELPLTSMEKARLFSPFTSLHVFEDTTMPDPAHPPRWSTTTPSPDASPWAPAATGTSPSRAPAPASCTLRDARFLDAPPSDLALRYGGRRCGVSDPLLLVQVTEFACRGYVVADAFGIAQLLQAIGELARGLPLPSVTPVRYDESIPDVPQLLAAVLRRHPDGFKPVAYAYCDVAIPRCFIDRVKAEWRRRAHAGVRPCTEFEAVTAAIWQCRARAIGAGADEDSPAPLVFAANIRKHVGAKEGYYGNCLTAQLVTAASGAVARGAIVELVRLIRDGRERIPEATVGAPACYPCLPCRRKDDDASYAVATCVTEEHVDEFRSQLSRLR